MNVENHVSKWGVLPFRKNRGLVEFLIISTKGGKWGLPKGNLMRKLGPKQTALQEAFEEAGIIGSIVDRKIKAEVKGTKMNFYPMEVKSELSVWPESNWRERKWVSSSEVGQYLHRSSLRSLLLGFSG